MPSLPDMADEVKTTVRQRIGSPLLGSFIVAWALLHWRPLLLLVFGESNFNERIATFDGGLTWTTGLWLPVTFAVIAAALYPLLSLVLYNYGQWVREKRRVHRLSLQEAEQLIRDNRRQRVGIVQLEASLADIRGKLLKSELQRDDYAKSNALYGELLKSLHEDSGGAEFLADQSPHARVRQAIRCLNVLGMVERFKEFVAKSREGLVPEERVARDTTELLIAIKLVERVPGDPVRYKLTQFGDRVAEMLHMAVATNSLR